MQKIFKETQAAASEAPPTSFPILADNHHYVCSAWRTLNRWIYT